LYQPTLGFKPYLSHSTFLDETFNHFRFEGFDEFTLRIVQTWRLLGFVFNPDVLRTSYSEKTLLAVTVQNEFI